MKKKKLNDWRFEAEIRTDGSVWMDLDHLIAYFEFEYEEDEREDRPMFSVYTLKKIRTEALKECGGWEGK